MIVAEDNWLASLYLDEMSSISDYVQFSARLRKIMGPQDRSPKWTRLTAGLSSAKLTYVLGRFNTPGNGVKCPEFNRKQMKFWSLHLDSKTPQLGVGPFGAGLFPCPLYPRFYTIRETAKQSFTAPRHFGCKNWMFTDLVVEAKRWPLPSPD